MYYISMFNSKFKNYGSNYYCNCCFLCIVTDLCKIEPLGKRNF